MKTTDTTTKTQWHAVSRSGEGELPEINESLESRPVLFMAGGQLCAGHYHRNGWFYNDVKGAWPSKAIGKFTAVGTGGTDVWCDQWRYMNDPMQTTDTTTP